MTYSVAAFYRFVPVTSPSALRQEIMALAPEIEGLCGTILLAPEGINSTLAASESALPRLIDLLDEKIAIRQGELKFSTARERPFNRFKVRLKKEIVTLRQPQADPHKIVGAYVAPQEWNALIQNPDVTVIDTRNIYETQVGIFEGAVDPQIKTFCDFPAWVKEHLNPQKHKKIAMFCTGGIRCEKASAYMLSQGFPEVYHLKGGILQYLEEIPAEQSLWQGECFVFDKRVALGHGLQEGAFSTCYNCRAPLSAADRSHADYEEGVSCAHCAKTLTEQRAHALRQRHSQFTKAGTH